MAITPLGIVTPGGTDDYDLVVDLAAMATSIDSAINTGFTTRQIKTYKWANAAARTAQTGMTAGDNGYQIDTKIWYVYGTAWKAWESDWITDTPTFTNLVNTGGTTVAQHKFVAGMVRQSGHITIGASASGTGAIGVPFAVSAATKYAARAQTLLGTGQIIDIGVAQQPIYAIATSSSASFQLLLSNGGGAGRTSPYALNAGDLIMYEVEFEQA